MKNWKPILAVLLIFAAGVTTGAMLGRGKGKQTFIDHRGEGPRPGPPGRRLGEFRDRFIEGLKRDVGVTDEQAQQIDAIMRESQERMAALWKPIEPKAREEMESTHAKVKALLTPEQQVKFEESTKRWKERGPGKHGPGGPGGPGEHKGPPPPPE